MSERPSRLKRLLAAAGAVAVAAGVAVGIAAGLGAFSESSPLGGISGARHTPTAADNLDPAVAASFARDLRGSKVRFLTQLGDGVRIYAAATRVGLCAIAENLPGGPHTVKGKPTSIMCARRLTHREPILATTDLATGTAPTLTWGIALDSVAAISFAAGGHEVTIPVENNVWAYQGNLLNLLGGNVFGRQVPLTIHFSDGSTETLS